MGELDFIKDIVKEKTEKSVKLALNASRHYARRQVNQTRNMIINSCDTKGTDSKFLTQGTDAHINIINEWQGMHIESFTNYDKIDSFPRAEAWVNRHGGSPSNYWVASLYMENGIFGLPAEANTWNEEHSPNRYNGYGWKNGYNLSFRSGVPLEEQILNDDKAWEYYLNMICKKIISNIEYR